MNDIYQKAIIEKVDNYVFICERTINESDKAKPRKEILEEINKIIEFIVKEKTVELQAKLDVYEKVIACSNFKPILKKTNNIETE